MKTVISNILNILSDNNISIYALSRTTGINQSTLHKILHFERTMKPKYFYTIVNNLPISLSDKNILTSKYQKLALGNDRYDAHYYILNMLKNFSDNSFAAIESHLEPPKIISSQKSSSNIYRGAAIQRIINILLIEEMSSPNPTVYVYVPGTDDIISGIDSIVRLYKTNLKIKFIIDLVRNRLPVNANYNLNVMQNIMPIMLSSQTNSTFYYTYVESITNDSYMTPYPYFIASSDKVIYVNHKLDEILLISDKNIAGNLVVYCEDKLKSYQSFLEMHTDVQTILQELINNNDNSSAHYGIEYNPCLSIFFTPKMIENTTKLNVPNRTELLQILNLRLIQLKKIKHSIQIFNKQGLIEFAKTGIIKEYPESYANPCSPEDRLFILTELFNTAKSNNHAIRAINTINLPISDCLSLIINNEHCLQFTIWNENKIPLKYLVIREASICKCFYDFINEITETNLIYSKAETLSFISEAISLVSSLTPPPKKLAYHRHNTKAVPVLLNRDSFFIRLNI